MNGLNAVFMVESVLAVSSPAKLKSDNRGSKNYTSQQNKASSLFAETLEKASQDTTSSTEAPREFKSVVYGKNMLFTSMQYKTREYR